LAQFILERFLFLQFLVASMQQFNPAIEHISVQSLKPYPRNARRHSRAQIKQIAASIERFGFNNPVLIADDGEIVAGHGRVSAAKLLGIETVPAVRLSHLSEAERRAYVIADNKLALNAGWDREMLAIELQGLVDLDFEIELTALRERRFNAAFDGVDQVADSVFAFIGFSNALNGTSCQIFRREI
jgi:ParB-like chromosome segregation protein Spo0J